MKPTLLSFKFTIPALAFLLCLITQLTGFAQVRFKRISPEVQTISDNQIVENQLGYGVSLPSGTYTRDGKKWFPPLETIFYGFGNALSYVVCQGDSGFWAGLNSTENSQKRIWKSSNGGKNWVEMTQQKIIRPSFRNQQEGLAIKDSFVTGLLHQHTLVQTTNGGNSWIPLPLQITTQSHEFMPSVSSPDGTHILAAFYNFILQSQNGGLTWDTVSRGTNFKEVTLLSSGFGYAYTDSAVHFTNNFGTVWTRKPFRNFIDKVQFLNPMKGWVSQLEKPLWRTNDGGVSWDSTSACLNEGTPDYQYGNAIGAGLSGGNVFYFRNENDGWATSGYGIFSSENGGQNWASILKYGTSSFRSAVVQTNERAWIVSRTGNHVLFTGDQGKTWTKKYFGPSNERLFHMEFFGSNRAVLTGSVNTYISNDGGQSWQSNPSPGLPFTPHDCTISESPGNPLDSAEINNAVFLADFCTKELGWITKANKLYKTINGGGTWTNVVLPDFGPHKYMIGLMNPDPDCIYLTLGPDDYILNGVKLIKSMDGGNTWTVLLVFPILVDQSSNVRTVSFFANRNQGFVFYGLDSVYTTDNGGVSFQPHGRELFAVQPDVQMAQDSSLFLTNNSGEIYRSNDFGKSFVKYFEGMTNDPIGGSFGTYNCLGVYANRPVLLAGDLTTIAASTDWRPTSFASGRVHKNENSNCTIEPTEIPLKNRVFQSLPDLQFSSSREDGRYFFPLDSGTYQIQQVSRTGVWNQLESQYCPSPSSSYTVQVSGDADTTSGFDFINEVKLCPVLFLSQNHFLMRPCRRSYLQMTIRNEGTIASDSEWVEVEFPSQLLFISANKPYQFVSSSGMYRFRLPPIEVGGSFVINIEDSVVCNPGSLSGQNLCVKSTIPDAPACLLQSLNWDGVNLEVASLCQSGATQFILHNKGASMASSSQYQIFIDSVLVYQASFQLATNGAITVTLPVNTPAGFARLVVPQSQNHPLSTFASAVANCATGESTTGMFESSDESPLVDIECVTVTNALDPNDKQVFPSGWGPNGNVEPSAEFKYKIRFQNTGSDTAFKVVLIDTLDEDLDLASLQIGEASHPFTFNVSGKGRPVLKWTFDNILLPDSNTNEEKSHGFVRYSVGAKAALSLGTRLENFAEIYFDYNDPVRTNTTVNTLWQPTYMPGVVDTVFTTNLKKQLVDNSIKISPNPATDVITIQSSEGGVTGNLKITDLQGRILQTMQFSYGKGISIKELQPGIYFLKIEGLGTERLVVNP